MCNDVLSNEQTFIYQYELVKEFYNNGGTGYDKYIDLITLDNKVLEKPDLIKLNLKRQRQIEFY